MNYEKKYNEALERARDMLRRLEKGENILLKADLKEMFPELAESEDEKIRKALIEYFNEQCDMSDWNGVYGYQVLAWLEKQGESIRIKEGKNYLCTKTHKYAGMEWIEGVKYYSPEDYSLVNQGCTCYCPKYSKEEHNNFFKEVEYDGCLEVDKLEPKFQNGQWVVWQNKCYKVNYNGCGYELIDQNGLSTSLEYGTIDENAHIWDITKDAKDGDVLALGNEIFIYAHRRGMYPIAVAHCSVNNAIGFYLGGEFGYVEKGISISPATKEQRELLFAKMKEEGYEWNTESKELKNVIIKPKFNVGDWVVDKYGIVIQILSYKDGVYKHTNGYCAEIFEDEWRMWTIQDAKDGDVLFLDLMGGKTFIYNGINPDMEILYSFIISNDGKDVLPYHIGRPNVGIGTIEDCKNIIHPATKEQRDLLFQKMEEEGYEWDVMNKYIKKEI